MSSKHSLPEGRLVTYLLSILSSMCYVLVQLFKMTCVDRLLCLSIDRPRDEVSF